MTQRMADKCYEEGMAYLNLHLQLAKVAVRTGVQSFWGLIGLSLVS